MKSNIMKKKRPRRGMAKRLTKALREKRRWVGVLVHQRLPDRASVEKTLEQISHSLDSKPNLRLMDFVDDAQRKGMEGQTDLFDATIAGGLAIVRAPLSVIVELRDLLEAEAALETWGVQSLTTSGKIRLVRERLGLPKPKRHRK
jgi:hypothetical protein